MSRKTALSLNVVIVSAYMTIGVLAPTPWTMFAGFLLLALVIRCVTLCWAAISARGDATFSSKAAFGIVAANLVLGLILSAALVAVLYWIGHLWLSGTKIIVPLLAVFIAYKSTFPLISRKTESD